MQKNVTANREFNNDSVLSELAPGAAIAILQQNDNYPIVIRIVTWKLKLIVTANDNAVGGNKVYLYTYWKAPRTLISSDVAWSPRILTASGAWTAIMHPLNTSSKPSPEITVQPDISHINSVNT